ncbi:hypothetical protein Daus18300_010781 [Diaporthe australafricana]|uniref:DUF7730 domain-containing protein n=1 Tax=Diaporthe australafricana TaxID=127596 RepID=A0ABR3W952_9PEZI
MYSTLVNWVQRQFWRESSPDTLVIPPLPFLPTPTPPSEDSTAQDVAAKVPIPDNGIFFERLPPDLRRMILIEAFGDRVVHIDLRYDRPLVLRHPAKGIHAGGIDVFDHYGGSRQIKEPRAWQWYSCVCHRDPEWRVRGRLGLRAKDATSHPMEDSCLRGRYIEGFEILYYTNRFNISGMPLIHNLRHLLPANALSGIESVEIKWDLGLVAQPPITDQDISADARFNGWRTYLSLLEKLPKTLPRLRYFHITLGGTWFPPQMALNDRIRHSEPAMLQPMDEMVRKFYRTSGWDTSRYIVAIPTTVFRARMLLDTPVLPEIPPLDLEEELERLEQEILEEEEFERLQQQKRLEQGAIFEPVSDRKLAWRSLDPESLGPSWSNKEVGYWLEEGIEEVVVFHEQMNQRIALAGDW